MNRSGEAPTIPLRVEGVIPPEPHYGPGTYEVGLRLSRRMSPFEERAFKPIGHRAHPANCILTLYDTTLERVAADAKRLGLHLKQAEEDGRRLEEEAAERARQEAARRAAEVNRLTTLAHSIRFD
jgi:2-methylcitrate dehydratase PrpD